MVVNAAGLGKTLGLAFFAVSGLAVFCCLFSLDNSAAG